MAFTLLRKSVNWVALALGFLFALGVGLAVLFSVWDWLNQGHAAGDQASPVYSRADFAAAVVGKTEADVLDAVGKPDTTSEDNDATYWHYRKRTQDPTTGQVDSDVQVVFHNGKVTLLNY